MLTARQRPQLWRKSTATLDDDEATALVRAPRCGFDRGLANLVDCGCLARDIVAGLLCGATAGLLVAMLGATF